MMESEQTWTRSVPVFMETSSPSACFWNEATGFIGAHWAEAEKDRQVKKKMSAEIRNRERRVVIMERPLGKPSSVERVGRGTVRRGRKTVGIFIVYGIDFLRRLH
jgi:hypothetical protein